jgi:hypothetical protein
MGHSLAGPTTTSKNWGLLAGASLPHLKGRRPRPRIVPGAWLIQAVFQTPKCRKVHHSRLVLCLRSTGEAEEPCSEGA